MYSEITEKCSNLKAVEKADSMEGTRTKHTFIN